MSSVWDLNFKGLRWFFPLSFAALWGLRSGTPMPHASQTEWLSETMVEEPTIFHASKPSTKWITLWISAASGPCPHLSHHLQIFSLSVAFCVQDHRLYCRSWKVAKCGLAQGTPLFQCRARVFSVGLISLEIGSLAVSAGFGFNIELPSVPSLSIPYGLHFFLCCLFCSL